MKDNYNGDDDAYGRQSLDALASAALEASTHDNKLSTMSSGFSDGTMDVGKIELNDNIVSIYYIFKKIHHFHHLFHHTLKLTN